MLDPTLSSFPFIHRKHFSFESGALLELDITTNARVSGTVYIRGMTKDGAFSFSHADAGDETSHQSTFRIPDIPVFVAILDTDQNFRQGDCFATLRLRLNGDPIYELCSGYVYIQRGPTWPPSGGIDMMPGRGNITTVSGNNPAAGAEATITVPDNQVWNVHSIEVQLVTSAAVANRRPHIVFGINGNMDLNAFGDTDLVASTTYLIHAAKYANLPTRANDNDILIPIPNDMILPPGSTISTETLNKQAGDDYAGLNVHIERFMIST